jgi:hypothetical protein
MPGYGMKKPMDGMMMKKGAKKAAKKAAPMKSKKSSMNYKKGM